MLRLCYMSSTLALIAVMQQLTLLDIQWPSRTPRLLLVSLPVCMTTPLNITIHDSHDASSRAARVTQQPGHAVLGPARPHLRQFRHTQPPSPIRPLQPVAILDAWHG